MRKIFILLFLVFALSAQAQDQVVELLAPNELVDGHTSAFLSSGKIIHVPTDHTESIEQLKRSLYLSERISFDEPESDEAPVVTNILSLPNPAKSGEKEMYDAETTRRLQCETRDPKERATLTVLPDYAAAQSVMDSMNGKTHDKSECYNRAHMWTFDALTQKQVNLGKLWIFFTRKYIREHRYKWWFHVAPYTEVGAERAPYMLDRGFTMIPYTVENWKNIYMKNGAACPVITDYQAYETRQEEAYCYLVYSSQYYWQPWQLKELSTTGEVTYGYKESQLKIAYRDALRDQWDQRLPVLRSPAPRPNPDRPTPTPTPTPTPAPAPQPPARDAFDLRVGDFVLHTSNSHRLATFTQGGRFDIQFTDGRREILRDVTLDTLASRRGCVKDICVGSQVVNTAMVNEIIYNTIHGITHDGRFVVSFNEGPRLNSMSWGWHESHFARTTGCRLNWCVGQVAYSPLLQGQVQVIGHQDEGLVLQVLDGPNRWTRVKFYRDRLTRP